LPPTPLTVHVDAQQRTPSTVQPLFAHVTAHTRPLHVTRAWHAWSPSHVMSHDVASIHSTFSQASWPVHCTLHGMSAGHFTVVLHDGAPGQVMTHVSPSHVPPALEQRASQTGGGGASGAASSEGSGEELV
jgi:hypothetical protein